jgi:hypothetical protein
MPKKIQSQTVVRVNMCKALDYKKGWSKMLMKLTTDLPALFTLLATVHRLRRSLDQGRRQRSLGRHRPRRLSTSMVEKFRCTGLNFINVLRAAFTLADPECTRKDSQVGSVVWRFWDLQA